jgi:hypothetical protein
MEAISLGYLHMTAWEVVQYISRNRSIVNSPCPEVFVDPSGRLMEYRLAGTVRLIAFPKRISERFVQMEEGKPYDGSMACYLRYLSMQGTLATAEESVRSGES